MITREKAMELIRENIDNQNLIKHMLACEVCMKHLAKYFNENEETWGMAGLLHDLDYAKTSNDPSKHGFITLQMLEEYSLPEDILDAIVAHPGHKERQKLIEKSLYSVDPLTGLIVAAALMHPEKKLEKIDVDFITRRFNEKRFAAGANRQQIKLIEETGLSLRDFISICLDAMKSISAELGL